MKSCSSSKYVSSSPISGERFANGVSAVSRTGGAETGGGGGGGKGGGAGGGALVSIVGIVELVAELRGADLYSHRSLRICAAVENCVGMELEGACGTGAERKPALLS